jgi:hypothetical protein
MSKHEICHPSGTKNEVLKLLKPRNNYDLIMKDLNNLFNLNNSDIPRKINTLLGIKFIDYFTLEERLNTVGYQGINFYEFVEKIEYYKTKNYINNIYNFHKNGRNNKIQIYMKIFQLYFGSIAVFKPLIAMNIYYKFKPSCILDFTMGWGGRMLAAYKMNIDYIGIDQNTNLIKPYEEMVLKIINNYSSSTKINLLFKNCLEIDYSLLDYDMVFTSPPYYNKEVYSNQEVMTKDQWNEFYKSIIDRTYKNLKLGGHYCLNVPSEIYENVIILLLGECHEKIPLNIHKRRNNNYTEFIYVWKRV